MAKASGNTPAANVPNPTEGTRTNFPFATFIGKKRGRAIIDKIDTSELDIKHSLDASPDDSDQVAVKSAAVKSYSNLAQPSLCDVARV